MLSECELVGSGSIGNCESSSEISLEVSDGFDVGEELGVNCLLGSF